MEERLFSASEILKALDKIWDEGYVRLRLNIINKDEVSGRGCALAGLASALGLREEYVNHRRETKEDRGEEIYAQ